MADMRLPFSIKPATDSEASHYAKYGVGGYYSVENTNERDNISSNRLEKGLIVYIKQTDKLFKYNGESWVEFNIVESETLNGQLEELNGNYNNLSDEVQTKYDELSGRIDTVSGDVQSKYDELDGRIDTLSGDVQSKYNELDGKIDALSDDVQDKYNELDGRIDTLSGNYTELREEFNQFSSNLSLNWIEEE